MSNLPVEPVTLGEKQREVLAIDSSTIARASSQGRNGFALAKDFTIEQGKQFFANIIAAVTTVVFISGVRVGRFTSRSDLETVVLIAKVFQDLPKCSGHRLLVVDAGIATHQQFAAGS